ncbi:mitochondrial carrier [Pseudovirgaria hyperparasitica]|uniref:Mitochondrial carrier n=1 Tax=Pseudovirgaria hyperparasitica TaxID=470096 RepID=A0A6A6W858_9PEZI|nr:mitochondrial carrier [Pseudovirgaria hyperparasitica]KAF2758140.1 mitochondrial carrier [Pseudovirgaria hyperparasitica]
MTEGTGKVAPSPPIEDVSVTQKMLSATAGSLLTSLLVTPLDVVRVRLQSQTHSPRMTAVQGLPTPSAVQFNNLPSNIGISTCCREVFWMGNNAEFCVAGPTVAPNTPGVACAAEEVRSKHFTSTFEGLTKIARNEGPTTLWRGLSPTLAMAIPANVIYFAGYDWLRTSPQSPINHRIPDMYAPLVAGSTARILAAIVVNPIEMFRTRMQAATHVKTSAGYFRETMHNMRSMVAKEGPTSLWRGLTLTLWRDVPFSAFYWWGYETGRNALTDIRGRAQAKADGRDFIRGSGDARVRRRSESRGHQNHSTTLVDSFIAGGTSGAIAAFVTTPFDVGKTRQQVYKHSTEDASAAASSSASKFVRPEERSMPRFLLHIFQEQGLSGLFRGWAARCLKVAPACAIMISSYEVGKKMANKVNERRHDD